ncbi:hypothetical protein Tco_0724450 [Tanacetum coccineum]
MVEVSPEVVDQLQMQVVILLSASAKLREVASLEGHVLLKKLIDAIDSKAVTCLKGCLLLLSKGVFGCPVYGY